MTRQRKPLSRIVSHSERPYIEQSVKEPHNRGMDSLLENTETYQQRQLWQVNPPTQIPTQITVPVVIEFYRNAAACVSTRRSVWAGGSLASSVLSRVCDACGSDTMVK